MTGREPVVLLQFKSGNALTDENYAQFADAIMKSSADAKFKGLTYSKLRGIYGLITNVYSKYSDSEDFEKCKPELQRIKVRMAYESGREDSVKTFLESTYLLVAIDRIETYDQFILYCRYAEALVAYFKFYGGKDK